MKVLLVNLPHEKGRCSGFPPSGLAYIAAVLKRERLEVSVLDLDASVELRDDLAAALAQHNRPDVVGISAYITQLSLVDDFVNQIRATWPGSQIVVGGMLASSAPDSILRRMDVDAFVDGEGEETFPELIEALQSSPSALEAVDGIRYLKPCGRVVKNRPRQPVANLDSLPYPAWEMFPIERYLNQSLYTKQPARHLPVVPSRGCPFKCTFCDRQFHTVVRRRDPEMIVDEVAYLVDRFAVEHIDFESELFNMGKKWALQICDELQARDLAVTWTADCRADLIDEAFLRRMRDAGCVKVFYGLESGSNKILASYGKKLTRAQIEAALEAHRTVNVPLKSLFLLGAPLETAATVNETIDLCKKFKITIGDVGLWSPLFSAEIAFLTPFPGTPLFASIQHSVGDLEQFVRRIGNWWSKPMGAYQEIAYNMTALSDEDLYALRETMTREINRYFIVRHPLESFVAWAKTKVERFAKAVANTWTFWTNSSITRESGTQ